ncbi:MAG TPA: hypothetical protein VFO65_05640 [Acidimicrobiales bacterium]|nr:hypothetical protein [Acidimicrobiales bacterium]
MPAPSGDGAPERPLSALPSPRARALAFAAIMVAGLCGTLIGWGFVDLQCTGRCATAEGVGAVVGGLGAAAGVAVVAVLTLRAMAEWKRVNEDELYAEEPSTRRRNPSA